jgi:hypothetical protein
VSKTPVLKTSSISAADPSANLVQLIQPKLLPGVGTTSSPVLYYSYRGSPGGRDSRRLQSTWRDSPVDEGSRLGETFPSKRSVQELPYCTMHPSPHICAYCFSFPLFWRIQALVQRASAVLNLVQASMYCLKWIHGRFVQHLVQFGQTQLHAPFGRRGVM